MDCVCQAQADAMGRMSVEMEIDEDGCGNLQSFCIFSKVHSIGIEWALNKLPFMYLNSGNCALDQFQCRNGDCINATAVCDYNNDCSDLSDEFGCGKLCSPICVLHF